MRLPLLISLSLLLSWQNAGAQLAPADDFFNGGAQLYISNNIPSALEKVESGLKFYPDDEKLKKLEQLLKQQQQQQSQQNQQQKKSQSEQQKKQQQSSQKNSQDQQKQDEQKQAEQKKAEQQKQQQQSAAEKKQAGQKEKQEAGKPGQMTPAEAKRLLDAQKSDEQTLQFKPPEKPRHDLNAIKDW